MMSMQSITTWKSDVSDLFSLARRYAHLEGTALLYSGGSLDSAQTTFLCLFPEQKISLPASRESWERLQREIGEARIEGLSIPNWIGYISYEMGCFADLDHTVSSASGCLDIPGCLFYKPSTVVCYDSLSGCATLYGAHPHVRLETELHLEKSVMDIHVENTSDTLESYLDKIAYIQEAILEGEVYQVNLSQQFQFHAHINPFTLFEKSVCMSPTPFAAYLQCGEWAIVSASPERFLRKQGERLETRPIKGTAVRGKTTMEDNLNKEALLSSDKERAELLMITDLMRSDLGRISMPGSIMTQALWRCESYAHVFHLLSIIESRPKFGLHAVELIRSLFPGGSVTGCPKLRAMEMIYQLEKRPRGIYTGSIGYFAENGDFDFNIAIRTVTVHSGLIQLQLGGAIVIDSDPLREFEETLHKGRFFFNVFGLGGVNAYSVL